MLWLGKRVLSKVRKWTSPEKKNSIADSIGEYLTPDYRVIKAVVIPGCYTWPQWPACRYLCSPAWQLVVCEKKDYFTLLYFISLHLA